ncbi:MAG: YfhO family protein, partial [Lachnospiraceae bacterium]|nr:YfhO family protein [Lachnospiraceae bacterium]
NVLALRLGKGAAWNPAASWDAGSGGGIPSIGAMSAGIAPAGFRGNPFSVLRSYRIGEISDSGRASFFCGSLALFGAAAFFCSGRIRKRGKAAGAGLLLFTVMSVFWQPLFVLFSLFQYSNSYWYRYGYLGSFVLLYLAAYWAGSLSDNADPVSGRAAERRQAGVILRAGAISIFLILLSQRILPSGGMRSTRIAVLVLAGITALLLVPRRSTGTSAGSRRAERTQTAGISAGSRREKRKPANSSRPEGRPAAGAAATAAALALAVLCIGEMFLQTRAMLGIYHTDTAEEYAAYSRQEQRQIEGLLSFDKDGFYRVNQTSTRIGNKDGLTAAYLDAMAYGYASVSGYTSCPENIQLEFLDGIGYRKEYESFNIVNTSFLPADSLLGVRYVLSGYGIPGLREVKELGVYNGKAVFENPFVLPVAMIAEEGAAQVSAEKGQDPFAYLEQIYGELSGQEAGLFVPAAAERSYNVGKTEWTIAVPDGNYCLYGNLPWREAVEGRLMVSEDQGYGYGGWLSPSVFYIPVPEEEAGASGESKTVRVTLETRGEPKLYEEQFYALDLDRLSEISALIRVRSATVRDLDIRNGAISCTADAAEGRFLILSVPASKGWTAFVNGKKTPIDTYEGCLIKIPLAQGENHITMQYRVPGMAAGIVMSLAGLAACAAMVFAGGRRGI